MATKTNNNDEQNDHQPKKGVKQVWQKKVPIAMEMNTAKTPRKEKTMKRKEALKEEAATSKEGTTSASTPIELPNNTTCDRSERDETPTSIPLLQLLQYVAILVTHRRQASRQEPKSKQGK